MTSHRDVADGKVPPKVIADGVVVPPGLQVNEFTSREHQEHLAKTKYKQLTEAEIKELYPDD